MSSSTREDIRPIERAREARLGLAANLRDIQQVGGRLIRTSEKKLKSSVVIVGIGLLGGIVIGLAIGRAGRAKRVIIDHSSGSGRGRELVIKAMVAVGARLATRVVSGLLNRASARADPRG